MIGNPIGIDTSWRKGGSSLEATPRRKKKKKINRVEKRRSKDDRAEVAREIGGLTIAKIE